MIKYRNTYRVSNDVCYIDCYNRFRIMVNRKEISLGHYKILEDALEARKQGEIKYFGKFRYNGDAEICRD